MASSNVHGPIYTSMALSNATVCSVLSVQAHTMKAAPFNESHMYYTHSPDDFAQLVFQFHTETSDKAHSKRKKRLQAQQKAEPAGRNVYLHTTPSLAQTW